MKRFLLAVVLAILAVPALAADVGVSISLGQPGFFGHIDIGNYPQPQLIYRAPVIVQPVPVGRVAEPVYLRVPPRHRKNWRKHCRRYGACGQRVYFVQKDWYNNVYVPSYRSHYKRRGGYARSYGGNGRNYYRNHRGRHDWKHGGRHARNYYRSDRGRHDRNHYRSHGGHGKVNGGRHAKHRGGNDRNYYRNNGGRGKHGGGHAKSRRDDRDYYRNSRGRHDRRN